MLKKFMDMTLSFEERVDDLLLELTLEEKLTQLLNDSPAIERLDISSYNWWNECLHGVARAGVATVFPQSIGMASTFNEDLIYDVACAISDEARAKYHEFQKQKDHGIYKGLTFWSPNLNILRDPRWGRGQETYGEDPYLTSRLGLAFIEGLQGNDPKYLKVAACAKHFAVHSGPEGTRHSFNATVTPMDLFETYLPAFETAVIHGKVEAVMGAYNRVNDEPCCGSPYLLDEILREDWDFEGHVVSDCGGIDDFHLHHHITDTHANSCALAIKSGCDLNCGTTYTYLNEALSKQLITEEDIDISLRRLLLTRFKLGQFDLEAKVPFSSIPYTKNDCKEHHKLSLETSIQSMVLLKNTGVLPLNRDILTSIAVIGPNADDRLALLGTYNGTPSVTMTPLDGIKISVNEDTRVFYAPGCALLNNITEPLATPNDRFSEAVSAASHSPITVLCLGLNGTVEGEEGDSVNSDSFGDNTSLKLPAHQEALVQAIAQTGTKLIIVIFSGTSLELKTIEPLSDAIIQAWYPGAFGGLALARLLFGDRDFSGRLPLTFVESVTDLPDFSDYSMNNRTYKFITKKPQYSFGYGLSYNSYTLKVDSIFNSIPKDSEKEIKITIKNLGSIDSFVPVQLYIKPFHAKYRVPNFKLIDIESLHLKAYESKTVILPFNSSSVQTVNESGIPSYDCSSFMLYIGFSQPDDRSIELLGFKPIEKKITLT